MRGSESDLRRADPQGADGRRDDDLGRPWQTLPSPPPPPPPRLGQQTVETLELASSLNERQGSFQVLLRLPSLLNSSNCIPGEGIKEVQNTYACIVFRTCPLPCPKIMVLSCMLAVSMLKSSELTHRSLEPCAKVCMATKLLIKGEILHAANTILQLIHSSL